MAERDEQGELEDEVGGGPGGLNPDADVQAVVQAPIQPSLWLPLSKPSSFVSQSSPVSLAISSSPKRPQVEEVEVLYVYAFAVNSACSMLTYTQGASDARYTPVGG